ncbi:uncharacterized protein LOC104922993 isoform X1 [Larimichthys crocea]|uniref:uncharacterized protein LOC104922993 isoform X1 n=1 Tax=Larimichthys crocea TaxID=215358 RepID=UPI000F5EDF68|nr:uncharacterized protein LOC104922993 isoform X1 [Larimichthys crocea]
MDNLNKDGDSDGRESCGFQISELLKTLAERKSPPCDTTRIDPRNISSTLSVLKNRRTGMSNTGVSFRSRSVLPENISQLSKCQFKRRDHLRESLSAFLPVPAPITTVASSQRGRLQPSLPSSDPVNLSDLVEKSEMQSSDLMSSIGEQLKKHEIHPHIRGKHCECLHCHVCHVPTNEWFFEDLTDLQRKLYSGASKKHGVQRHS